MSADVVVRLDAATVTYGSGLAARPALKGVDLVVGAGEHLALVGPSGSGKSTLLHAMGGLQPLTSGTVAWPLTGPPNSARDAVATVFQAPSLIPALTVVENVELPLLIHGQEPATARLDAISALASLGLDFLRDRLPEELSGGQVQRVAAARVLAGAPRLILADEPTGQLDEASGSLVVNALIHAATIHGAALIIATHDERVWRRFPHRLYVDDGRVTPEPVQVRP